MKIVIYSADPNFKPIEWDLPLDVKISTRLAKAANATCHVTNALPWGKEGVTLVNVADDECLFEIALEVSGTDLRYEGGVAFLYAHMAALITNRYHEDFAKAAEKFVQTTSKFHEQNRWSFKLHPDWREVALSPAEPRATTAKLRNVAQKKRKSE